MRKLLLSLVLALMFLAVVADDASAGIFKRRNRATCYCPPPPCFAPVIIVPGNPSPSVTAGSSIGDLLKVLEPAKSPEVPADIAKLIGLKPKTSQD